MIYPLISKFKEQSADPDFEAKEYTELQAALALELLKKSSRLSRKRRENAGKIIGELEGYEALVFPQIPENVQPALNRLPVLFKDLGLIDKVKDGLDKAGIESSRMYYQPLHLMFDLGYKKSDFPKAEYFAEHLLTLPVHPLMKDKDITRLIETIKRCL
jgi:dTDP-4-amino-4,6-dideoxygalactose transaminase